MPKKIRNPKSERRIVPFDAGSSDSAFFAWAEAVAPSHRVTPGPFGLRISDFFWTSDFGFRILKLTRKGAEHSRS
jgi:hypothetical protein